jgi:hypothetical protein
MTLVACIMVMDSDDTQVFQVIYNVIFALLYICYLVNFKPLKSKEAHGIELFTEFCFLTFGYTVMCFTFFVPDAETRFQIGWGSVCIISLNLVVNMVLILRGLLK